MRVQFQLVPLLPKLAWLAEVNLDEMTASVRHGQYVEVRSGFFIEGVWNGPFAKGDFGRTEAVFGSGWNHTRLPASSKIIGPGGPGPE